MVTGITTVVLILLSFQIFKKSFLIDNRSGSVSREEFDLLKQRYNSFFFFFIASSLPVFLFSFFFFLWLFRPYNVNEFVSLGLSFAFFSVVPKLILESYKTRKGNEWFNGLKIYLDNKYGFNYFKVLDFLFKVVYAVSVGLVVFGLYQSI